MQALKTASQRGATFVSAHARYLEERLWGGFSSAAEAALRRLAADHTALRGERIGAAWALARWHANRGEAVLALKMIGSMHALAGRPIVTIPVAILESQCLAGRDRLHQARRVLARAMREHGRFNADLCLAYSSCLPTDQGADQMRLGWINNIYRAAGFAQLAKLHADEPLGMDNLAAANPAEAKQAGGPKVSVIMPTFNAAAFIRTAVGGVLRQTWQNLELVIVDDCSTDGTWDEIRSLAASDSRVIAVRQNVNGGVYAARNRGLALASGALITTHDADDWSHPQKLETQIEHLLANPALKGTRLHWIRAATDLRFGDISRSRETLVSTDYSSFMFWREVVDRLGRWDGVRAAGDTEFIARAEAVFGADAFERVLPEVPLSFGRLLSNSLTSEESTSVRTVYYGVRRTYRDAWGWWHARNSDKAAALKLQADKPRPFPAPPALLPDRPARGRYDCLVVLNFNMRGGAYVSTMNYIRAMISKGLRVAVFHWPAFGSDPERRLHATVWELAAANKLDVVSPGESIRARVVLVGYPVTLVDHIDDPPKVDFEHLVFIVNQMSSRLHGGKDKRYDPAAIVQYAEDIFGSGGTWIPISGLVRRLMKATPGYPTPHFETWCPLIDVGATMAEPLAWRGDERPRPVVGRHSRDHYTKWPAGPRALLDAYCADRPCSVRLLGGADMALKIVGDLPLNWSVHPFDSIPVTDFLRDLDFFIHYPHEEYIEEFGRAVIEAMAAGKPAILPPVFRETFEGAAIYAEPAEVWDQVAGLWRDRAAYLERARLGREFVSRNCGYDRIVDRLNRLGQKQLA